MPGGVIVHASQEGDLRVWHTWTQELGLRYGEFSGPLLTARAITQ